MAEKKFELVDLGISADEKIQTLLHSIYCSYETGFFGPIEDAFSFVVGKPLGAHRHTDSATKKQLNELQAQLANVKELAEGLPHGEDCDDSDGPEYLHCECVKEPLMAVITTNPDEALKELKERVRRETRQFYQENLHKALKDEASYTDTTDLAEIDEHDIRVKLKTMQETHKLVLEFIEKFAGNMNVNAARPILIDELKQMFDAQLIATSEAE